MGLCVKIVGVGALDDPKKMFAQILILILFFRINIMFFIK